MDLDSWILHIFKKNREMKALSSGLEGLRRLMCFLLRGYWSTLTWICRKATCNFTALIGQWAFVVVLVGDSCDEVDAYAVKRAKEEGYTFIPTFDHPDVILGQGTVGMEIVHQVKGLLHAIIGVEPCDANAMALSLYHGERVVLDKVGGFADGVSIKVVGGKTFC